MHSRYTLPRLIAAGMLVIGLPACSGTDVRVVSPASWHHAGARAAAAVLQRYERSTPASESAV